MFLARHTLKHGYTQQIHTQTFETRSAPLHHAVPVVRLRKANKMKISVLCVPFGFLGRRLLCVCRWIVNIYMRFDRLTRQLMP